MEGWYQLASLSVGGSPGVNARHWLGVAINRWAGRQFPCATLAINVSGSFAIGLVTVLLSRLPSPHMRLLLVVGFLGGYTTFSSFSAEAQCLRIYADSQARWHGHRLYEAIVARARAMDVAGASVFPIEMSYGSHGRIHDAASDYGSVGLPVVIEIVDAPGRIDALLADLGPMIAGRSRRSGRPAWSAVRTPILR